MTVFLQEIRMEVDGIISDHDIEPLQAHRLIGGLLVSCGNGWAGYFGGDRDL